MLCISAAYAIARCPLVCPSLCPSVCHVRVRLCVTFLYSVEMCKHIGKIFLLSDIHIILDFAYQTLWQHSNGGPLNRGVECTRGRQKSLFSMNICVSAL